MDVNRGSPARLRHRGTPGIASSFSSAYALPAAMNATRLTIASLIAAPVVTLFGVHTATARLEQATRRQCAAQDWPIEQHAAHSEFCRLYLATR